MLPEVLDWTLTIAGVALVISIISLVYNWRHAESLFRRKEGLEEMRLPVWIGEVTEDIQQNEDGTPEAYWRLRVHISGDELSVGTHKEGDKDYISVGEAKMAWTSLPWDLSQIRGVKFLSEGLHPTQFHATDGAVETSGAHFSVWVKKATDRTQYEVTSREIVSRTRHFIRLRLSDYKSIKKGFREQA